MGHQQQQPESAHVHHTAAAAPTAAMADIDMNNRDPNNINDYLRVTFEDVLAEPEGIHSMNCVWSNSYTCFNCCKVCELNCGCLQKLYGMLVHCCLDPWCEAMSICFSAFKKAYHDNGCLATTVQLYLQI